MYLASASLRRQSSDGTEQAKANPEVEVVGELHRGGVRIALDGVRGRARRGGSGSCGRHGAARARRTQPGALSIADAGTDAFAASAADAGSTAHAVPHPGPDSGTDA
jgi:hypothetical protein